MRDSSNLKGNFSTYDNDTSICNQMGGYIDMGNVTDNMNSINFESNNAIYADWTNPYTIYQTTGNYLVCCLSTTLDRVVIGISN